MQHTATLTDTDRYARCIAVSKIQGRNYANTP
jgi:hypothetical protein